MSVPAACCEARRPVPVVERTVPVNGIELHFTEAGEGPPVVLCHGFPELSFSWRHQIPALAEAGYRVIAPDMRGYGRSSQPTDIAAYSIDNLAGDLYGLLDVAGIDRAVFVGHDWGAQVVWNLSVYRPDRMVAVAGLSVPFLPRSPIPPTQLFRNLFGDSFFYILYFQEPGVADAELNADPAETFRKFASVTAVNADEGGPEGGLAGAIKKMTAADGGGFLDRLDSDGTLPAWMSEAEFEHFAGEFRRTGYTGGLNYYRNFDRNWELLEPVGSAKVEMPAAFMTGSADVGMAIPMPGPDWVPDLRFNVTVDGAGHWLHQERPNEVNAVLLDFLAGLDRKGDSWA